MNTPPSTWNEIANEMINTWTETGSKVWQSWFELMDTIPSPTLDQGSPELAQATQRFFDNREILVRFLKLSVEAWQDLLPKLEQGAPWLSSFEQYTAEMRSQLAEFSRITAHLAQNSDKLWQLYGQEMQKYNQLWLNPLGGSLSGFKPLVPGNSNPLIELNNLYWNLLYEENFGSLLRSPAVGPTRELTGKLLRGFDAWSALYQASNDYQLILADIQVHSFEALMKTLVEKAEAGEMVTDWKQFQTLWSQVSDEVFEKAFCDDKNLKIRGRFLNSLNRYRLEQQALSEVILKNLNLPTRQEVDEIHETIYHLRKEVKQLRAQLGQNL